MAQRPSVDTSEFPLMPCFLVSLNHIARSIPAPPNSHLQPHKRAAWTRLRCCGQGATEDAPAGSSLATWLKVHLFVKSSNTNCIFKATCFRDGSKYQGHRKSYRQQLWNISRGELWSASPSGLLALFLIFVWSRSSHLDSFKCSVPICKGLG